MYKNITIAIAIILCSDCNKGNRHSACGTQVCTDLFATVGVVFTDKNSPVTIINFKSTDLRTNKVFTPHYPPGIDYIAGYAIVVDDSYLKDLSSNGDDIQVSGTDQATGQTKSATIKVSGGECNCHVTKISGVDKIVFD